VARVSEVFCDRVDITVPCEEWLGLRADISQEFDAIGMGLEVDAERVVLWRAPGTTGTVKASRMGLVWAIGCSGAVCAGLRAVGRFNAYLAAFGARPHRVTQIHASMDLPLDGPAVVASVAESGRAGHLSLTRKRIRPQAVTTLLAPRVSDGALTGTVYCGTPQADARMCVYDKQEERLSRGLPDVGPLTRYELRLKSKIGLCLRDASEPAAVFWHHVSPSFLPLPSGAPAWFGAGSGFHLDHPPPLLPARRLLNRLEASEDVRDLLRLAVECGPHGVSLLVHELLRLAHGVQGLAPADTAPNVH